MILISFLSADCFSVTESQKAWVQEFRSNSRKRACKCEPWRNDCVGTDGVNGSSKKHAFPFSRADTVTVDARNPTCYEYMDAKTLTESNSYLMEN